uniref:BTB domain-containing protein n=1 Tax=Timema bartmani TaxID=61472 RepID=A0A7R9EYH8_9NEOP|nr:unnamed protein product [Timema bartmani]
MKGRYLASAVRSSSCGKGAELNDEVVFLTDEGTSIRRSKKHWRCNVVRGTMADAQHFCLRWNNYQSSITSAFENLRDDEDFVDVTLACDGRSLKAHRVVLSACSPYFRELLKTMNTVVNTILFDIRDTLIHPESVLSLCIKGTFRALLHKAWMVGEPAPPPHTGAIAVITHSAILDGTTQQTRNRVCDGVTLTRGWTGSNPGRLY